VSLILHQVQVEAEGVEMVKLLLLLMALQQHIIIQVNPRNR